MIELEASSVVAPGYVVSPASAQGTLLDWLARPAERPEGVALPTCDQMRRAAETLEHIRQALSTTIQRKCGAACVQLLDNQPLRNAVFSITLNSAAFDDALTISLDADAARALLDPVLESHCGLRGAGAPTPAELGVLEFLFLEMADRLSGVDERLADLHVSALDELPSESRVSRLRIELCIAGRAGCAEISSNAPSALAAFTQAGDCGTEPPVAQVLIGVCLPRIPVSEDEFASIEIDDRLLVGASTLGGTACDLSIATTTGWRLSACELIDDSPTVVSARCGEISVGIQPDTLPGAKNILPIMGSRVLDASRLASWRAGDLMDFPKNPQQPVLLVFAGRVCGVGELERVGHELAIRVLSWNAI